MSEEILREQPESCPYCGSDIITYTLVDISDNMIERVCDCLQCENAWFNQFQYMRTVLYK